MSIIIIITSSSSSSKHIVNDTGCLYDHIHICTVTYIKVITLLRSYSASSSCRICLPAMAFRTSFSSIYIYIYIAILVMYDYI